MLLPRYGCRARTVTVGGPRSQRTWALYPMHCSVFSAKSGRVRPSMCSSGKRRSHQQDRVSTRVPGLDHARKPRGPGSNRPPTLRDQTPPRSSGPLVPPGTDSTSRWSPKVGYFQGLIVGPSGATFSSVRHLGCLATPPDLRS
ncbi:hypothetical protein NDU88_001312 [Pleurodeles waltl]|uniref:Uncharacterized protein n=1 Tax=Pleurodeles waltl TaxID=8319 RepID=A0AAV7WI24_PLEWA|nr:hypothetical protein NDU88_001312 [Pleurodeles waltl]